MTTQAKSIFSGEPLPVAPHVDDANVDSFYRKLIDYLRRLSAKLDKVTGGNQGGGEVSTFAAVSREDQSIDTDYTSFNWTRELHKDPCYDHDESNLPETIGILCDGFYVIHTDYEFTGAVGCLINTDVLVFDGSAEGELDYSLGTITLTAANITHSRSIPLALRAGSEIEIRAKRTGDPINALKAGTRITVIKLSNDPGGAITPCEDCDITVGGCMFDSASTMTLIVNAPCTCGNLSITVENHLTTLRLVRVESIAGTALWEYTDTLYNLTTSVLWSECPDDPGTYRWSFSIRPQHLVGYDAGDPTKGPCIGDCTWGAASPITGETRLDNGTQVSHTFDKGVAPPPDLLVAVCGPDPDPRGVTWLAVDATLDTCCTGNSNACKGFLSYRGVCVSAP